MKKTTKKDALSVKDLPVSGSKSTKVKGGVGGGACCNTNTMTCKQSCICKQAK